MANEHLETYLNDHLAGAVAAIELLEHLQTAYANREVGHFVKELLADIEADRQELRNIMTKLNISESSPRKATAWIAGKFTELKLRLDDKSGGALHLYEALEGISLGIEGKRSLWMSLATAAEAAPELKVADYERLRKRAEDQRGKVEVRRLEAAKRAFLPDQY